MSKKRDNWFNDYHNIPELGIKGTRNVESRISVYDVEDFKNATVIDLGCNMVKCLFKLKNGVQVK